MNADSRPDPDSLLHIVQHDSSISKRGRMKVFFGASAGVGKTYAMLLEAKRRISEGVDVLAGVVETHGRPETAELTRDLPYLPPRRISHKGIEVSEFDLEAALLRAPELILMDELAHTNAHGSRHPKRWQDVEELLANGIDVYTTLNVQHLESINDMVAKLTGIQVRETVPDRVFDQTDDVALIDIPSDELIKRLQEGKVYIAEGANKRAAENFFKKTNLVALRELALRRTAERVDAENDILSASMGLKEAQVGQKLLVCIGHDALSARVIRHAKRMAASSKTQWYALYVETDRHEHLSEKARLGVERNLRLAERLGAKIIRLSGSDAADETLGYARSHGITRIIIGHRIQSKKLHPLRTSLSQELIERGYGFEITTISEEATPAEGLIGRWRRFISNPTRYLYGLMVLAVCTALGMLFRDFTDSTNLAMFYLAGVVLIAAKFGTGPSTIASLLSIALFNFFFTRPYYSFEFYETDYYFTFAAMFVTSLVVGSLAAKLSIQAKHARRREQETSALYELTRGLSAVRGIGKMADTAISLLADVYRMEIVLFVAEQDGISLHPKTASADDVKEASVARWVIQNGQLAGRNTDTLPSARGLYVPLMAEGQILGALGVLPENVDYLFGGNDINRLETYASLIASAFQRARRAEEAERTKLESESQKLKNVLLSSVSHDLRTPLASITGAASSALMLRDQLPEAAVELLGSIHGQAARLAKLVTNLLDATSLESGNVRLNKQTYFIQEVIGSAITRVQDSKGGRLLLADVEADLPLVHIDGLLIEQVLVNLLDNAIRFTDENGRISISARSLPNAVSISVQDDGIGFVAGEEERIFEKFYTHGHQTEGNAGLGLAICRGILSAHGGSISAHKNEGGGACFIFILPNPKELESP